MAVHKINNRIQGKFFIGMLFMSWMIPSCYKGQNSHERAIQSLISRHIHLREHLRVDDVYKLLMQGRMGIGHMITDTVGAKTYLLDEIGQIDENDTTIHDSLFESVSPDSSMLRVNLRPFKKKGLQAELLFRAMLGTAANHLQEKDKLIEDWNAFLQLNQEGYFHFPSEEADAFHQKITAHQYPVIHHSNEYTRQYKPAYRVVLRSEWKKFFKE